MCKYYLIDGKHIFLFVDHSEALFCWKEAIDKGWITRDNLLIHIDKHADLSKEDIIIADSINLYNLSNEELKNFKEKKIDNTMFIFAGILSKTIKQVVSFHREDDGVDFDWIEINDRFKYFKFEDCLIYSLCLHNFNKIFSDFKLDNTIELREAYENKDIILDIDIDYFTQGCGGEITTMCEDKIKEIISSENFKDIYYKSKVITIALEPTFCGGNKECFYIFKKIVDFIGKNKCDLLKDAKQLLEIN